MILGRDDPKIPSLHRNSVRPTYAEHATVFGVYDFIERYLGVRWYLPIDLGEVAPKTNTLNVPVMDIIDAPNKIGRCAHIRYGADDRDDPLPLKIKGVHRGGFLPGFTGKKREAFLRQRCVHALRMRYQTTMTTGNHTMWRLIAPKRFSETHPEYFALFKNGKRGTSVADPAHAHHCFTNPGAVDEMIRLATAAFRGEDPKAVGLRSWIGIVQETARGKAFHILQDDAYKPCFCTTCEAFRKQNGLDPPESETEIVWSMVIKVANAVRKEFPDCVVSAAAYGPMKYPPKQKMPDNILISGLAVSGPCAEFVPGMRELNDERVERWIKTVGGERIAGFYEYALKGGWESGVYKSHKSICGSIPRAYASYYQRMEDAGQGT